MTERTRVTGLADGASNCWSVLKSLRVHCQDLECILDWFHISQKFQQVTNGLGEGFEQSLDSAKWTLWHGEAQAALTKLKLLQATLLMMRSNLRLRACMIICRTILLISPIMMSGTTQAKSTPVKLHNRILTHSSMHDISVREKCNGPDKVLIMFCRFELRWRVRSGSGSGKTLYWKL